MSSSPNECRRQALACVQLAQASASPEDRKRYANLAARWISLAGDLEAIDTQLRSEPAKRKTG